MTVSLKKIVWSLVILEILETERVRFGSHTNIIKNQVVIKEDMKRPVLIEIFLVHSRRERWFKNRKYLL